MQGHTLGKFWGRCQPQFADPQTKFATKEVLPCVIGWLALIVYCKFVNKLNTYCKFASKPNVWGYSTPATLHGYTH